MDPGVIFMIDPFRLHDCMALLNPRPPISSSPIPLEPALRIGKH